MGAEAVKLLRNINLLFFRDWIMKISLNWLREYVDFAGSAEEAAEILSNLGLPCEGIEHLEDDSVIDVEVTSNRGDCLGHIGMAREIAAATGKTLRLPEVSLAESEKGAGEYIKVEIAEPDLCYRYTARVIEGVKVGPSPEWMRKRLEAVGMRSVNNVVDATNYAMMETGQPPHAFDYAKIGSSKIIVRKGVQGEILVSIDGTKCELNSGMLVIADAKKPVAIAGVMGGLESEVSESTMTILLEDAYFDPICVRGTSRKLALLSEAAYRFERIVDVEMIDWASKRTAQLIVQAAGGKVAKGVVDAYPKKAAVKKPVLRVERMKKVLGIEVAATEAAGILERLGFKPEQKNGTISCEVPSWRSDVYREADLIEEVMRVYGYGKIPTERKITVEVVGVDERQKLVESIGTYLNGCGYYETINVSFVDNAVAGLFMKAESKSLAVKDVTRKTANLLRSTLIGSLMGVLKTNINAKNSPCRIFEIADTFLPAEDKNAKLPNERTKLTLVCDGNLRELRGAVDGLINSLAKEAKIEWRQAEAVWAEVGADIAVNGKIIGTAGIVSGGVRDKFDFKDVRPCAAELDLEELAMLKAGAIKVKPIARFPAIERDLSLLVDETVVWAAMVEAVNKKAPAELEEIRFVDIYRGKGIAAGKKSVTLSLRFRDEEGTLKHEDVDGFEKAILASLKDAVGAELRSV